VNRQPSSLWLPNDRLRLITAGRSALSAALFVGSSPCWRANVHRAGSSFSTSVHTPAVLAQVQAAPSSSKARTSARSHPSMCLFSQRRPRAPSRTLYHSPNSMSA